MLEVGEFLGGVLDLGDVVVVRRLVQRELGLVLREFFLRLLQFQGKSRRRLPLACLEVRLDACFERFHVLPGAVDLAGDPLHEGAVLLEPLSALLHLIDGLVVLVLQLGDRIGGPEEVGDLVHLGREGLPELAENHGR